MNSNLRQLRAWLAKEPLPYTAEALRPLAEHLNETAIARREERIGSFKEAVNARAERAMQRGQLHALAEHELCQALKLRLRGEGLTDDLTDEVARRLLADVSTIKTATCLLDEGLGAYRLPAAIQDAFGQWLLRRRPMSINLLEHLRQTQALKSLVVEARDAPAGHVQPFVGLVHLIRADGSESTYQGSGMRKRDAEQAAAYTAVVTVLSGEVSSPREAMIAPEGRSAVEQTDLPGAEHVGAIAQPPAKPQEGGGWPNPRGALNEACQAKGWVPPVFNTAASGPPHAPRFVCTASITVDGKKLQGISPAVASKKEAEAEACRAILVQLQSSTPSTVATSVPAASQANPVGVLQELAQRERLALPLYEFTALSEIPPSFQASVRLVGSKIFEGVGVGRTKQEAKSAAARAALANGSAVP